MTEKKKPVSRAKEAAAAARKLAPKKPETIAEGTPADKPGATELYFQNGPDAPYAYHLGTYETTAEAKADAELLFPRLATSDQAAYWLGGQDPPEWEITRATHDATGEKTGEETVTVKAGVEVRPYA